MSAVAISRCRPLLAGRRNSLALLSAWEGWRGDGVIPRSSDVRPEDLGRALSSISILEAHAPDRLIYRLFGGMHAAISGRDLKGMNLIDFVTKAPPDEPPHRMWSLAETPCGGIYAVTLSRPQGSPTPIFGLVLPVAPGSAGEPMLLYASVDRVAVAGQRAAKPVSRIDRPSEFTYIDIGYGAPV